MAVLQLVAFMLKVTCAEIKQVLSGGSFCLENVFPTKDPVPASRFVFTLKSGLT